MVERPLGDPETVGVAGIVRRIGGRGRSRRARCRRLGYSRQRHSPLATDSHGHTPFIDHTHELAAHGVDGSRLVRRCRADLERHDDALGRGHRRHEKVGAVGGTSAADARTHAPIHVQRARRKRVRARSRVERVAVRAGRPPGTVPASRDRLVEVELHRERLALVRPGCDRPAVVALQTAARTSAISSISSAPMPSVVTAGVPSRRPLVYHGPLVSSGMTLRFSVMPAARQRRLGLSAVETERPDVDEHEVVVGAAGHDRDAPRDQRLGEHPGVVDDRRRVGRGTTAATPRPARRPWLP